MPELKAYTDDSAKSGHYILANVGAPHPITIQVTDLGDQILQKAGYSSGDNVPTNVVWSMFDVGILYTSGTINDPPEAGENPDKTFRQLGVANKLSTQEQNQLLSYLDEYTGPNQDEVSALRDSLEQAADVPQSRTTVPDAVRDDLDRLSNLYERGDLRPEEYELLKSRILDDFPSTTTDRNSSDDSSDSDGEPDTVHFDIIEKFWNLVPEDKYDDSFQQINLEDTRTDEVGLIFVSYHPDNGGFTYFFGFREPAHEERLFETVENHAWELVIDNSDDSTQPSVTVRREASQDGFRGELPSGYVNDEVSHFLDLVQAVYGMDSSDLALAD